LTRLRDPLKKRAGIALSCAIFVFMLASLAHGQEAYTIVDVQVVGNRVATTSLILGSSSLVKGSTLTLTAVEETIKRLYGLGIFSDVSVEAENVTGGVKVYIVVKELPRLAGL
jgi:outer membrane protein assembly factor BamA